MNECKHAHFRQSYKCKQLLVAMYIIIYKCMHWCSTSLPYITPLSENNLSQICIALLSVWGSGSYTLKLLIALHQFWQHLHHSVLCFFDIYNNKFIAARNRNRVHCLSTPLWGDFNKYDSSSRVAVTVLSSVSGHFCWHWRKFEDHTVVPIVYHCEHFRSANKCYPVLHFPLATGSKFG